MKTQHTTQTTTVKEMQTLTNTCKKYADDTATHWQQVHNLTAAAHSAANRADFAAIDAISASADARKAARTSILCLLFNLFTMAAITIFTTLLITQ